MLIYEGYFNDSEYDNDVITDDIEQNIKPIDHKDLPEVDIKHFQYTLEIEFNNHLIVGSNNKDISEFIYDMFDNMDFITEYSKTLFSSPLQHIADKYKIKHKPGLNFPLSFKICFSGTFPTVASVLEFTNNLTYIFNKKYRYGTSDVVYFHLASGITNKWISLCTWNTFQTLSVERNSTKHGSEFYKQFRNIVKLCYVLMKPNHPARPYLTLCKKFKHNNEEDVLKNIRYIYKNMAPYYKKSNNVLPTNLNKLFKNVVIDKNVLNKIDWEYIPSFVDNPILIDKNEAYDIRIDFENNVKNSDICATKNVEFKRVSEDIAYLAVHLGPFEYEGKAYEVGLHTYHQTARNDKEWWHKTLSILLKDKLTEDKFEEMWDIIY